MSIANKNKISFKFLQNLKMWAQDGFQCYSLLNQNCRSHSFGRFVALEWAWHSAETNLRESGRGTLLKQTCAAQESQKL